MSAVKILGLALVALLATAGLASAADKVQQKDQTRDQLRDGSCQTAVAGPAADPAEQSVSADGTAVVEPGPRPRSRHAQATRGTTERPAATAAGSATAAAVEEALGRLNPRYRTALVLKDLQGLGNAEIAEIMGVSRGTVGVLLFRSRAAFEKRVAAPRPTRIMKDASRHGPRGRLRRGIRSTPEEERRWQRSRGRTAARDKATS